MSINETITHADRTLVAEALRRGATRREVMGWLMAMGATTALASGIVGQAGQALAATPKRGGLLRVAGHSHSAKDTLDPAKMVLSTDYARGHMFCNALTRLDGQAQPHPELAESFEPNADATEWVFKLRKGVTFHDGKTLDAADVVYSIMRHKDKNVASAASALAAQISEVKADGNDTVIVRLHAPNADLPIMLGTFQFMILQKGTTEFNTVIGTGPFKVKEFTPGVRSIAVRNENYFKQGRPYVDEIEFFGISDAVARLNALLSGDVHMMSDLKPNSIGDVERSADAFVFATPCPRFAQLIMMVDRTPFSNLDLRLAIKNLFDREKVVKTLLKGYGVVANDHPIMPDSNLFNADLPQRGLDRDKAKFHLKKAGMENGKLELHVSDAAGGSVEQGLLVQREAARIGLTIQLKREPADGYWGNIWRKRSFHAGVWNPRPTYDMLLTLAWKSDAKWNESQIKNARLDALIDQGRATVDPAKRKEIYGEIQKIIYEKGGNAIPAFQNYLDAVSKKVKGLSPVPVGNLGGFNFADSVWLDA